MLITIYTPIRINTAAKGNTKKRKSLDSISSGRSIPREFITLNDIAQSFALLRSFTRLQSFFTFHSPPFLSWCCNLDFYLKLK